MRAVWSLAAVVVAGAVALGAWYRVRPGERVNSERSLHVVHPEQRLVASTVNATGTVRLRVGSEVRVGSQLSGIVKKLNVTVGSHVRAGDVIAEIDDRPILARLADADAQIALDRAGLERAQVDERRAEELAAQSLIPAQQAEDLKLARNEAQAKYMKSVRDRDLVKVDLDYVDIRAPISGTIASVSTQQGETVASSFAAPTFVTIIGEHALELVAMVDETDIANVHRRDPARFTVDAYPTRDFTGIVENIAPKATIVSGVVNYEVTIKLGQDESLLKPDMTANVTIQTAQRQAVVLQADAVHREGDQSFVELVTKASPERRFVVTGNRDAGWVEIKRGVSPGESVLAPQLDAGSSTGQKGNSQ